MTAMPCIDRQADVLVAGGGPAGVSAALAAARCGARVILCQDRPVLGGNASSEVRMHMVGANGMQEGIEFSVETREGGIVEEIRLEQCVRNPQRSASMMDLCLYDLCRREPNLQVELNCTVTAASLGGERIDHVVAERYATLERFRIQAAVYIDCTGDAALGHVLGAPYRVGREGRDIHGERLAPESGDTCTLGSTLLYQARRHARPMPFAAPPWARRIDAEDLRLRPFGQPGMDLNLEYGFWWLEWGGHLDTIRDNEKIRDELLAILMGVWDFIKNRSGVDAANWALDWCGFVPGKRESRRLLGQHILTEQDLLTSREFPDAIATGGWPIDTHPPMGIDAPEEPPCRQHHLPFLYDIPLRCCLSAEIKNFMFAGRNISASHVAFASARVMATCSSVGQGVGTAAAYAALNKVEPIKLPMDEAAICSIQQELLRQDCLLLRRKNEDPRDLARQARVEASSEQTEGKAAYVLDGWTRAIHGEGQPARDGLITGPPGAMPVGPHRWMSNPGDLNPTIVLRWNEPVEIARLEFIFDTGLHRLLTLSMADGYTQRMCWGQSQPETIRDLQVEAELDGSWKVVARLKDNYQRRRVLLLKSRIRTRCLRITVTGTNGINHARIFEIRAYPPDACAPFLGSFA